MCLLQSFAAGSIARTGAVKDHVALSFGTRPRICLDLLRRDPNASRNDVRIRKQIKRQANIYDDCTESGLSSSRNEDRPASR